MIRFGKVVSDAHAIACDGGVGALKRAMCACGRKEPKCRLGLHFGKEETALENKKHRFAMIRFGKAVSDAHRPLQSLYGTLTHLSVFKYGGIRSAIRCVLRSQYRIGCLCFLLKCAKSGCEAARSRVYWNHTI